MSEPENDLRDFLRKYLTDYKKTERTIRDNQGRNKVVYEWIFAGKTREEINISNMPIVEIWKLGESSEHQGMRDASTWDTVRLQIDVVAGKDVPCVIDGVDRYGEFVAVRIARDISNAIKNNWLDDSIFSKYGDVIKTDDRAVPFDEERGVFRRMLQYTNKLEDAGE